MFLLFTVILQCRSSRVNSAGSGHSSSSFRLMIFFTFTIAVSKEISAGSGHSSSSSSGVLVPGVDDKDVDWDDDLDLNDDDMSEEEAKRIMQSIAANKRQAGDRDDGDLDVSG